MSRRARRNHSPAFNAKVTLAAIKGDRTIAHCRAAPFFRRLFGLRHPRVLRGAARHILIGYPEATQRAARVDRYSMMNARSDSVEYLSRRRL